MIIIQEKTTAGMIPFCVCIPQAKEVCQCQLYSSIWIKELNDGSNNSCLTHCSIYFKAYDNTQGLVIDYHSKVDDKISFSSFNPHTKAYINYHKMSKQVFPNIKSMLEEIIDEGRRAWKNCTFG